MRTFPTLWLTTLLSLGACARASADRVVDASTAPATSAAGPERAPVESAEAPSKDADASDASGASDPRDDADHRAITFAIPEALETWRSAIEATAARHGVEADLVALVVWLESRGRPDAVSPAGARGLMQLMPATAAAVAASRGEVAPDEAALLDPQRNLELGCALLAELRASLAPEGIDADAVERIAVAYNGGPKVLRAWQEGAPLPEETERYAAAMRERWQARRLDP